MAKPKLEFFNTEAIPWEPIKNSPGQYEKILSMDPETIRKPAHIPVCCFQNRIWRNVFQVKVDLQAGLFLMMICGKNFLSLVVRVLEQASIRLLITKPIKQDIMPAVPRE